MVFRVVTWIITVIIGAVPALYENAPLEMGLVVVMVYGGAPGAVHAARLRGEVYGKGVVLLFGFFLLRWAPLRMYIFGTAKGLNGPWDISKITKWCQLYCALDCAMFMGRRGVCTSFVATSVCSLGDIQFMPTRSEFAIFRGFFKFWSNAPKFRSVGGGVCMLFEICEKRPFQKCMVWGGGRRSQF